MKKEKIAASNRKLAEWLKSHLPGTEMTLCKKGWWIITKKSKQIS